MMAEEKEGIFMFASEYLRKDCHKCVKTEEGCASAEIHGSVFTSD